MSALLVMLALLTEGPALPPDPWVATGGVKPSFVEPPILTAITNQPPIAVINLDVPPQPPVYAVEVGLNTQVPMAIQLGWTNDVLISYPVEAGKVYQIQFKMDLAKPWCCAYNDYIPAFDGEGTMHVPIFNETRFFRVMSN